MFLSQYIGVAIVAALAVLVLVFVGCHDANADGAAPGPPILLVFTADWCSACQRDKAQVDAISKEHHVCEVDADSQPGMLKQWNVRMLPTYIVVSDGDLKEIYRTNTLKRAHEILHHNGE